MKLSAFSISLKEAIKHAPDPQTKAELQAIYDRTHSSGVHTLDDDPPNPDGGGNGGDTGPHGGHG